MGVEDEIAGPPATGGAPSRRYGARALALTGAAGVALGGLVGSLVTSRLAVEPPASRIFIAAGAPERALGSTVFPVSVVNAGPEALSVVGVRLARDETAGTPLELVGEGERRVAANDEGELLVRAPAACPPELQGQPIGVQLGVVVRVGDGPERPVYYRLAGLVAGALSAEADC